MSRTTQRQRTETASTLVWGMVFIVIAVASLLTVFHLVTLDVLKVALPIALILAGTLGLIMSRPTT